MRQLQPAVLALTGVSLNGMNMGYGWVYGTGYFLANFTISGTSSPVFKRLQRSSTGVSAGTGIAFDSTGHVLTAGWFQTGITLGDGASVLAGAGSKDAFLAQYSK